MIHTRIKTKYQSALKNFSDIVPQFIQLLSPADLARESSLNPLLCRRRQKCIKLDNGAELFVFDGVEYLAQSILNPQPGSAITEEKFSIISLSIPKEINASATTTLLLGRRRQKRLTCSCYTKKFLLTLLLLVCFC